MKEPKTGDKFYEEKGLVRARAFLKPSSVRRYKKSAIKRGWSLVQIYSHTLEKNIPKR